MDRETLAAYDTGAADFAKDWHDQAPPADLQALVQRFFHPGGRTADIGCGSGREVAFLGANGFDAIGYDASAALLNEARRRYSGLAFEQALLPELADLSDESFDNVLCETVIMHLPREQIAPAVRRLFALLKPDGILYLSWRVTAGADLRDPAGRLYTAFDRALVRDALGDATVLLDDEPVSLSSGKTIHRIVARKNR
jgi:2-polyprenyl-3-methyl-5-hydroxy-6-metoxy-1,4-benzoquinol methylase